VKDIIAVAALFAFTSSAGAQEKKAALIPSTYEGCMQPAVLESLVMQGPDTWGLGSDHSEAFREVQGYFLCHAVAGRGEDSCTTLQNMPDFKWSKLMGVNCKMDFRALMTHESLAAKQTSEAVRHCSRWCRLSKGERDKKMVCPNVCRKAIEEFRRDRDSACSVTMKETARGLGVGRDWVRRRPCSAAKNSRRSSRTAATKPTMIKPIARRPSLCSPPTPGATRDAVRRTAVMKGSARC